MSAAHDTIYWAERALGEPFQVPNLSALRRKYLHASMLTGLAFASTIAAGTTAAWLLLPDRPPRVILAQFSYAAVTQDQSTPALPLPKAAEAGRSPVQASPTASVPNKVHSQPVLPDRKIPAAARPTTGSPQSIRPAKSRAAVSVPPAAAAPVRTAETVPPRLIGDLVEIVPERPAAEPPAQVRAPLSAPQASARAGLTAEAAAKPQDIAPSEKLGMRGVFAEGIELLNGKRIRIGERLPNGELLQATDPVKGMVETDRRVMTIVR